MMAMRGMVLTLLILGLATTATVQASCKAYSYWWNVGSAFKLDSGVLKFGIVPGNSTQTGAGCSSSPTCKSWSAGLWPYIDGNGKYINGGVPQAANLTAHLQELQRTISEWIPDPDWDGNAVFDWEDWTPIWEDNDSTTSWHSIMYKFASIALVQKAHPTWNASQVQQAASTAFETAAIDFFVETLKLVTELRPKAKWGFYGFPPNYVTPCQYPLAAQPNCGYDDPAETAILQAKNSRLQPIWDASTALFPSIYVPSGYSEAIIGSYINSTTKEAVRLAAGRIPVRPFTWSDYHNGTTMLPQSMLELEMTLPYYHGADGVVIWGDPAGQTAQFSQYLNATLGPLCAAFLKKVC